MAKPVLDMTESCMHIHEDRRFHAVVAAGVFGVLTLATFSHLDFQTGSSASEFPNQEQILSPEKCNRLIRTSLFEFGQHLDISSCEKQIFTDTSSLEAWDSIVEEMHKPAGVGFLVSLFLMIGSGIRGAHAHHRAEGIKKLHDKSAFQLKR